MTVNAFISCRFPIDKDVEKICSMLEPDIVPYISTDVKIGSLPHRLREKIGIADCLIAILTEAGSSAFIQNEVGIAFALNKPIFAIYEQSVDVSGIQPYLSTFIKYDGKDLAASAKQISSLKITAITAIASREISGGPEELLEYLTQSGIQGIYPDRATAFRVFMPIWDREGSIRIVGSTIEGFKRGVGIDASELIQSKLEKNPSATIFIILTHASFARYREQPEGEPEGYITGQVRRTTEMLQHVAKNTQSGERLKWKFFKGAPTCFMIMAGNFMLLNPYLYMQSAHFNFSMIIKNTNSPFDIFNHYKTYHFQRAWDAQELCTDDPGF